MDLNERLIQSLMEGLILAVRQTLHEEFQRSIINPSNDYLSQILKQIDIIRDSLNGVQNSIVQYKVVYMYTGKKTSVENFDFLLYDIKQLQEQLIVLQDLVQSGKSQDLTTH